MLNDNGEQSKFDLAWKKIRAVNEEASWMSADVRPDLVSLANNYLAGEKEPLLKLLSEYEDSLGRCDRGVSPTPWNYFSDAVDAIKNFISIVDDQKI